MTRAARTLAEAARAYCAEREAITALTRQVAALRCEVEEADEPEVGFPGFPPLPTPLAAHVVDGVLVEPVSVCQGCGKVDCGGCPCGTYTAAWRAAGRPDLPLATYAPDAAAMAKLPPKRRPVAIGGVEVRPVLVDDLVAERPMWCARDSRGEKHTRDTPEAAAVAAGARA